MPLDVCLRHSRIDQPNRLHVTMQAVIKAHSMHIYGSAEFKKLLLSCTFNNDCCIPAASLRHTGVLSFAAAACAQEAKA